MCHLLACAVLVVFGLGLAQSEDEIPLVCANHTKPLTDTIGNAINSTDNCESLNCPKDHVCMPDFDRYYCCNKEAEEFYEDLQLCPGGAIPYSVELKKTFDKEKKEHFKHIPNAKSCDKLECPGEYICRKSKKSAKCCPRDFRHTDYAVSVGIISQNVTVTRQYCPAGKPASVKEKTLSCGIFFNKESPEICPKDHVCLEFNNEESRCCPSTGPPALFASPACAETKTAILTFGCGLAVGLSGLADVFSNLFKSESLTTTIAPKTPVHTVADLGKKGWIFAGSLNSSLSMEDQTTNVDATHKEAKINVGQGGCNHAIIQRQLHCMSSLDGTDCPAFEIIKKAVIDSTGDGCQDPEQMEEKFNAYNCLRETLDTAKGAECFNGSTDVLKKELDENFPSGGFKRFCDHLKKVFICAESVAQLTCKKKDVKKLMTLLKSDYDDMFSPFLGSGCITGNPVKISSVAIQSKYHQQKAANKTAWLSAVFN